MAKSMLVVYYSWSNGNTEKIAEQLADACGADLARIDTVEAYPEDYEETVQQGQDEVNAGYQPAIEAIEFSPEAYDVVAVGTPTWWYTMAPAVSTFFSEHDWHGNTLVPFMTNGGWPGSVIDDMADAAEGATVEAELEIQFDSTGGDHQETPQAKIDSWIDEVKALLD